MNRAGHVGFTLTVVGLALYVLDFTSLNYLLLIMLSAFFSVLPDIDLRLEVKHRKYTHNIFIALVISILIGLLTQHMNLGFTLGFIACLSGFLCHIAGDLLTYMSFPPLWPIMKKEVSLKLFSSNNKIINDLLMVLGVTILVFYVFKVAGLDILKLANLLSCKALSITIFK
ncbi:MAG: metal-dependent hydrolase [Candidatus Nezhaarchaeales archaeon]